MVPDESPQQLLGAHRVENLRSDLGPDFERTAEDPLTTPRALRPLIDDADGLIRALFACGFTSAAVLARHDIDAPLSEQLTTLINDLDDAIRGIRNALAAHQLADRF